MTALELLRRRASEYELLAEWHAERRRAIPGTGMPPTLSWQSRSCFVRSPMRSSTSTGNPHDDMDQPSNGRCPPQAVVLLTGKRPFASGSTRAVRSHQAAASMCTLLAVIGGRSMIDACPRGSAFADRGRSVTERSEENPRSGLTGRERSATFATARASVAPSGRGTAGA